MLAPGFANRLSARTVLFTAVPESYLDERKLRKVFGSQVRNVWVVGDSKKVDDLVEERDKVAFRLEKPEVKLLKAANKARVKAAKTGSGNANVQSEEAEESTDLASRWVPAKKRPSHRLGKFGLYGKKVDTIEWSRDKLEKLVPETDAAQVAYRHGENKKLGSVFIEFAHQSDAQTAYQTLSHHQALHMSPRYIGIHPDEVIWKSLKVSWWQRIIRRYAVLAFISALIIFWAIPVAGVGFISNISYMEQFSWLSWLKKIPSVIMGVVTGLLPSAMLSVLMSLVPIIMRRGSFFCVKLV